MSPAPVEQQAGDACSGKEGHQHHGQHEHKGPGQQQDRAFQRGPAQGNFASGKESASQFGKEGAQHAQQVQQSASNMASEAKGSKSQMSTLQNGHNICSGLQGVSEKASAMSDSAKNAFNLSSKGD